MHKKLIYTLSFFVLFQLNSLHTDENLVQLNFIRRHEPNSQYLAEIAGESSVSCLIKTTDNKEKEVKNLKKILFSGKIFIEKCDENSNPSVIKISTKKLEGSINENTNFFKSGFNDFTVSWKNDLIQIESSKQNFKPSPQEVELLSIIFRSPKTSGKLEDIFGENITVQANKEFEWQPPVMPIINIFKARGLILTPDNISSKARFKGISIENSTKMAHLETNVSIRGIEHFHFDYSAQIKLPVTNSAPPLFISSCSTEKIIKKNPELKNTEFFDENINEIVITITNSVTSSLQLCQDVN